MHQVLRVSDLPQSEKIKYLNAADGYGRARGFDP